MEFVFNGFYTLISAVIVLLLGRFLVNRIDFLKRYNIPEPVAGGLVAAVVSLLVHTFGDTVLFLAVNYKPALCSCSLLQLV